MLEVSVKFEIGAAALHFVTLVYDFPKTFVYILINLAIVFFCYSYSHELLLALFMNTLWNFTRELF